MRAEAAGSAAAAAVYSPALPSQVRDCRRHPGGAQLRARYIYSEGVAQRGRRQSLSSRPSHIPGPPAAARALPTCRLNEPIATSRAAGRNLRPGRQYERPAERPAAPVAPRAPRTPCCPSTRVPANASLLPLLPSESSTGACAFRSLGLERGWTLSIDGEIQGQILRNKARIVRGASALGPVWTGQLEQGQRGFRDCLGKVLSGTPEKGLPSPL